MRGVDATFEFKLGKTGPATSLVLHQNQTASRIEEESKQESKETQIMDRALSPSMRNFATGWRAGINWRRTSSSPFTMTTGT